jgi:hypothetical protein
MFLELEKVMNFSLEKDNYRASMQNNVFGKKSQDGIKKTSGFLSQLYQFNLTSKKFKAFRFFWSIADENEKVMLSFIFAVSNDYLLQENISVLSNYKLGEKVELESIENSIEKYHPNRYTKVTQHSIAKNIASSWKQAGFITGRVKNIRTEPEITYRIVSFAMLLAFFDGSRGDFIFQNNSILSLCTSENKIRELAVESSKRDFMRYQYAGNVTSINFDSLLNKIGINAI